MFIKRGDVKIVAVIDPETDLNADDQLPPNANERAKKELEQVKKEVNAIGNIRDTLKKSQDKSEK